jgi:TolB-like protein/Flp pilus assembly protein TadD
MSNQVSAPSSRSGQSSAQARLDSWKEIAAYLRREVRTVQRWEKSASLPVHRLQIEKQSAIYAYKAELDAWYNSRRPDLESDAANSEEKETSTWFERLRQPWIVGVLAALIVVLSGGTYFAWKSWWFRAHSAPTKIKLAVLPFKNISPDPEQEYFSDGMTEEMITELGRMQPERLGVIARTSAMLYKETQKDLSQICRELGVQYVLEGSVFRAGNRARITAQLIQCSDQTHMWADSSERDLVNIVSLQADVARAVAKNIKLVLTPDERTRLSVRRPVNPEAYQAYLKGKYFWGKFTPDSIRTAISFFNVAIRDDDNYAQAYAALAECYDTSALLGESSPEQAYSNAKAAAKSAAALDETLAETHQALAVVATWHDWDWATAEREYRRAIELNPNFAEAHMGYMYLLMVLRRPGEASAELRTAQALDPISELTRIGLVENSYLSKRYDEAIAEAKQWQDIYPEEWSLYSYVADAYMEKGMDSIAVEEYLKAQKLVGASEARIVALSGAYSSSGVTGFWRKRLALDSMPSKQGYVRAYDVAYDYAALGDRDHCLEWLNRALLQRDGLLIELSLQPRFDLLRSDRRFQDLLRRIGLPQ